MAEPKTHRERAKEAAEDLRDNPFAEEYNERAIARIMFPAELVEAATELLRLVKSEARELERKYQQEFATREIKMAEQAIALYPTEQETT